MNKISIKILMLRFQKMGCYLLCSFIPSRKIRYQIRSFASMDNNLRSKLPFIYSSKKTLNLLQKGYSIARFGDGELPYITRKQPISFQAFNKDLRNRLIEILKSEPLNKLIISIPHIYGFCYKKFYIENIDEIKPYLNYNRKYGDTIVTREPIIWGLKAYRKIWEGRKVVFIVSKNGRFDKDKRFFDNIKESKFIDIPPVNAFDKYDEILKKAKQYPKDYLFLIAAGPTATVLAYDLYKSGYQAIDIGHLPNCYQYEKGEKPFPEDLPNIKK